MYRLHEPAARHGRPEDRLMACFFVGLVGVLVGAVLVVGLGLFLLPVTVPHPKQEWQ